MRVVGGTRSTKGGGAFSLNHVLGSGFAGFMGLGFRVYGFRG